MADEPFSLYDDDEPFTQNGHGSGGMSMSGKTDFLYDDLLRDDDVLSYGSHDDISPALKTEFGQSVGGGSGTGVGAGEQSGQSTLSAQPSQNTQSIQSTSGQSQEQGPMGLLLGDLTWWTSDEDLINFLSSIPMRTDAESSNAMPATTATETLVQHFLIPELTFSEHKINGKSKGIAYLQFDSAEACRKAKETFESVEIHGRRPSVKFADAGSGRGRNPFRVVPRDTKKEGVAGASMGMASMGGGGPMRNQGLHSARTAAAPYGMRKDSMGAAGGGEFGGPAHMYGPPPPHMMGPGPWGMGGMGGMGGMEYAMYGGNAPPPQAMGRGMYGRPPPMPRGGAGEDQQLIPYQQQQSHSFSKPRALSNNMTEYAVDLPQQQQQAVPSITAVPSQQPHTGDKDSYHSFRAFTQQSLDSLDHLISYFHERQKIERAYYESLERLAKKVETVNVSVGKRDDPAADPRTMTKAWVSLEKLTMSLGAQRWQLAGCLDAILTELKNEKSVQQQSLDDMRRLVKAQCEEYTKKLSGVPKLRNSYFKRHREMDDSYNTSNNKSLKLSKDKTSAEMDYRRAIQDLESARLRFETTRMVSLGQYEKLEYQRIQVMKKCLETYTDAESKLSKVSAESVERCILYVSCISPHVDTHAATTTFHTIFPTIAPTLYESPTHGPSKDMVFSYPLDALHRHTSHAIPPLFLRCLHEIEARGLDKEGIYRVSGRQSDVAELRSRCERDLESVDWGDFDINVVAGLVKSFLRMVPGGVIPVTGNGSLSRSERVDISSLTNPADRVMRLRAKLNELPTENYAVLKVLVEHLARVAERSGENKMTVSNLGVIFGMVVFGYDESEGDVGVSKAKDGKGVVGGMKDGVRELLGKDKDGKLGVDGVWDVYKSDGVMEDLITYQSYIFSNADVGHVSFPGRAGGGTAASPRGSVIAGGAVTSLNEVGIPMRTDSLPGNQNLGTSPTGTGLASGRGMSPPPAQAPTGPQMTVVPAPIVSSSSIESTPTGASPTVGVQSPSQPLSPPPPVATDRRESLNSLVGGGVIFPSNAYQTMSQSAQAAGASGTKSDGGSEMGSEDEKKEGHGGGVVGTTTATTSSQVVQAIPIPQQMIPTQRRSSFGSRMSAGSGLSGNETSSGNIVGERPVVPPKDRTG
ncbi:hypothetical protein HDU85_003977 [Gaertneriomyces sp. JEL0708]|nr:hypothetical protein HDU85_003977 [Gaertneriomyces sp. JEL0708]